MKIQMNVLLPKVSKNEPFGPFVSNKVMTYISMYGPSLQAF